jgi:hypothetical protein
MGRFNLKKLNEVAGKEKYRVEFSNQSAALEDLDAEVDINSASLTIRENVKISAKESLGYYEFLDLSNKQNCSGYRMKIIVQARYEASRHFRKKKREYLK